MRLQSVSAIGVRNVSSNKEVKKTSTTNPIPAENIVHFRGNPKQVIFYGAEFPDYDKKGGVANVMGYYDKFPGIEKVIVQPYYRARKDYNNAGKYTGKIVPHQFSTDCQYKNLAGKYFYSKIDFEKKNITTETTSNLSSNLNGNIIVLEEVASKDVTYGKQPEQTIRLFRAMKAVPVKNEKDEIIDYELEQPFEIIRDNKGNFIEKRIKHHYFVFSKGTGEFKVPYDDGSYSSDRGLYPDEFSKYKPRPYAENNRAFVEFKDDLCKSVSSVTGKSFEPGTVVCSDSQTAYTMSFMRDAAIKDNPAFLPQDVSASYVIHNMRKGYTGECGGLEMALNLGLSEEEIDILRQDPEFLKAEELGETNQYFTKYLDELVDSSGSFNPTLIAFKLREKGYSTGLNTVSGGYAEDLATNENIPTALREEWAKLYKAKKAVGIMNPFADSGFHVFEGVKGMNGYLPKGVSEIQEKLRNLGEEFAPLAEEIHAFPTLDKSKFTKNEYDEYKVTEEAYDALQAYKQECKKEFLNRLTSKFDGLILKDKDLYNTIVAGRPNWNVNLIGRIDEKLLAPDNVEKLNVYATWGRLDSQKSLDIVMDAFDMFCQAHPEEAKNSILILGGEAPGTEYSNKVLSQAEKLANKYAGHVSFMEAFAPNKILASAAKEVLLPSREAPCELTDVETMQFLTMLTATRAQGMDDKNFDPADGIEEATSFKTETGYYISAAEIEQYKKLGIGDAWKKEYEAFRKKVENEQNNKAASAFTMKEGEQPLSLDDYINYSKEHRESLDELLDKYRSLILTAGVATCMERGLALTKEQQMKICENQLNLKTGWENNHKLTRSGESSADSYRRIFATTPESAENYKTPFLNKLRIHLAEVQAKLEQAKKAANNTNTEKITNTIDDTFKKEESAIVKGLKKYGKYVAGAVVVAGVIGGVVHNKNKKESNNNRPKATLNKLG